MTFYLKDKRNGEIVDIIAENLRRAKEVAAESFGGNPDDYAERFAKIILMFYLIDVKSEINEIAFDYTNTVLDKDEAIKKAKEIAKNPDVLDVSVHKWILLENGDHEHSEDADSVPYHYVRPPMEMSPGWIPVSSGIYPADEEVVQVTYIGRKSKKRHCDGFAYMIEGKWKWKHNDMFIEVPVTAWKPNCKPYMGK